MVKAAFLGLALAVAALGTSYQSRAQPSFGLVDQLYGIKVQVIRPQVKERLALLDFLGSPYSRSYRNYKSPKKEHRPDYFLENNLERSYDISCEEKVIFEKKITLPQQASAYTNIVTVENLMVGSRCNGTIITNYGHVLTNYHCVEWSMGALMVESELRKYNAEIVATNPKNDLALLVLPEFHEPVQPLQLRSSPLLPGEEVTVFSSLRATEYWKPKQVEQKGEFVCKNPQLAAYIQTDHRLVSGQSGSPALDSDGKVVGVASAVRQPGKKQPAWVCPKTQAYLVPADFIAELILGYMQ